MYEIPVSAEWLMDMVRVLNARQVSPGRYEDQRPILCDEPDTREFVAQQQMQYSDVGTVRYHGHGDGHVVEPFLYFTLRIACGKCKQCRKKKAYMAIDRIEQEIGKHNRNYFGTFTYGEQRRLEFIQLNRKEQYEMATRDLQLAIKRLRSKGFVFRYAAACEPHKDGTPHIHVIFHTDMHAEPELTKRVLERPESFWPHGRRSVQLVLTSVQGHHHAVYLAKYIYKEELYWFHHSTKYGDETA